MSTVSSANAAIRFHAGAIPGGRDGKLMGLQAANEGFLRGFARHAQVDPFHCLVEQREHVDLFTKIIQAERPNARVRGVHQRNLMNLADPGCVAWMDPSIHRPIWRRRAGDQRAFSVCGLTHTISSQGAMEGIVQLLLSPMQDWDVLVCTSEAVVRAVGLQLEAAGEYFKARLGARAIPKVNLATIPLGVDCDALKRDESMRTEWRRKLGIAAGDLAALFVGRLSFHAKANPFPMYAALERAAKAAKARLHLIQAGWFANSDIEKAFRDGARDFMPSVAAHFLDGRQAEVRTGIWSAGDIFISLVDNVQETFGIAPVEAMAAGLPGVVSDWNGYKETVRDGEDGFRIPTAVPSAGSGEEMVARLYSGIETYDRFIGGASQAIAVDIDATASALTRLIGDANLRAKMAAAAQARARAVFDWRVVIAQYQKLWGELAEKRRTGNAVTPLSDGAPNIGAPNIWAIDPFRMFAHYATDRLTPAHRVALIDKDRLPALAKHRLANYCATDLPEAAEVAALVARLEKGPASVAELLQDVPANRRATVERGIVWLAKYGIAKIATPG